MQIAGIQKTTLVDFPGKVAATVFLRGCNFRCGFCHNPELVLPEQFLPLLGDDELFRFLESRVGKLQGVCITGGEPLLWGTTRKLISHIKALGFAVKLDTNGSYPERLQEIINDGDLEYIAMDIKAPLDKYHMVINPKKYINKHIENIIKHEKYSKSSGLEDNILESIKMIMSSGINYEFRTTVVKPLHDLKDLCDIGKMIRGAKRFYIQNFVRSKHIEQHHQYQSFTNAELKEVQRAIAGLVGEVGIR